MVVRQWWGMSGNTEECVVDFGCSMETFQQFVVNNYVAEWHLEHKCFQCGSGPGEPQERVKKAISFAKQVDAAVAKESHRVGGKPTSVYITCKEKEERAMLGADSRPRGEYLKGREKFCAK